LVTDISAQLDSFGQFEDQQNRIESLQGRIQSRRELIRSLGERVNAVSVRIESWERADREWQEKTRKRLKVVWIVTSVIFFLVLSLFIGSQYGPDSPETTISRVASEGLNNLRDAAGTNAKTPQEKSWPSNNTVPLGVSSSTPDMLRVFDEL
jgi:hypothetical protein